MALSTYVLAFFCESLHMVPFLILAFFPFYQQLRMPAWAVALLCVVSQFMQSAFYLYLTYHHQSLRPTDYVFPCFRFSALSSILAASRRISGSCCIFIFSFLTILFLSAASLFFWNPALTGIRTGIFITCPPCC